MDQTNEQIQREQDTVHYVCDHSPALLQGGWWSWFGMYLGSLLIPRCSMYKMEWYQVGLGKLLEMHENESTLDIYVCSAWYCPWFCPSLCTIAIARGISCSCYKARLGDWKLSVNCYTWVAEFEEHVKYCVQRFMWFSILDVHQCTHYLKYFNFVW